MLRNLHRDMAMQGIRAGPCHGKTSLLPFLQHHFLLKQCLLGGLFILSSLLLTLFPLHLFYCFNLWAYVCRSLHVPGCVLGVGSGQLTEVSALLRHVGPRYDTWVTSLES